MRARDTAYLNHVLQTFSLLPVFRPILSKQGENSVALINVAINFGYEYFSFVIYFFKIFFIKLFSQTFFSNFFAKFVFWGLYSRYSPVYRDKTDSMYLCYEKYDIHQANIAFQLQHTKFSALRLILRPGNHTTLSFKIQNWNSKFKIEIWNSVKIRNSKSKSEIQNLRACTH